MKLAEKGIIFEPFQTRVYPHSGLFSHIIGQTDYDNYGISGVENYYDKYLRNKKLKRTIKAIIRLKYTIFSKRRT